jgi:hypothetical protein
MDLNGDLVGTQGLYGLVKPDTAAIDPDIASPLDGGGDVRGGHRAEEALVLARAGLYGDNALVKDPGDLARPLGHAPVALLGLFHLVADFL